VNPEVAGRVNGVRFLTRMNDEFISQFPVGKSRQTKHTSRVPLLPDRRRTDSRGLCSKGLCLILAESTHFPHNLVLARRSIEDKVWRRDFD